MADMCGDNRFEIIARAKADLLESTNIETDEAEMAVIDNILFRCWQMGWLDRYDHKTEPKRGEWIYGEHDVAMCDGYRCNRCDFFVPWDYEHKFIDFINDYHFCPNCGADMREREGE